MKKRALSLFLAFVMTLGLAAPAFAAEDVFLAEEPVVEEPAAPEAPAPMEEPVPMEPAPEQDTPAEDEPMDQPADGVMDAPDLAAVTPEELEDEPMAAASAKYNGGDFQAAWNALGDSGTLTLDADAEVGREYSLADGQSVIVTSTSGRTITTTGSSNVFDVSNGILTLAGSVRVDTNDDVSAIAVSRAYRPAIAYMPGMDATGALRITDNASVYNRGGYAIDARGGSVTIERNAQVGAVRATQSLVGNKECTVSVNENGKVDSMDVYTDKSYVYIRNTGTVTDMNVQGGRVDISNSGSVGNMTVLYGDVCTRNTSSIDTLTVEGGSVTLGDESTIGTVTVNGGTVTIDGGTVDTLIVNDGTVNITGYTFYVYLSDIGTVKDMTVHGGTVNIYADRDGTGGEVAALTMDGGAVSVSGGEVDDLTVTGTGKAAISGGRVAALNIAKKEGAKTTGTIDISGGTVRTMTVREGAGGTVNITGGTVSELKTDKFIQTTVSVTGSTVNIMDVWDGGTVAVSGNGRIRTLSIHSATADITGGRVDSLTADWSTANISDGEVERLSTIGKSKVNVTGGTVTGEIDINETAVADITGGTVKALYVNGVYAAAYIKGGVVAYLSTSNNAWAYISDDGKVTEASINDCSNAEVSSGGTVTKLKASAPTGRMIVSGGKVVDMTVVDYGKVYIYSGEVDSINIDGKGFDYVDIYGGKFGTINIGAGGNNGHLWIFGDGDPVVGTLTVDEKVNYQNVVRLSGGTYDRIEDKSGAWHMTEQLLVNGYAFFLEDGTGVELGSISELEGVEVKQIGPATADPEPKANTLTYNENAQDLVTAGEAPHGEVQYSTTGKRNSYSTVIPTGTNAGTYQVWWKVQADTGYTDYTPAEPITVTIAPEEQGVTLPTAKTGLTYTGDAQQLLKTEGEVTGDGTMMYALGDSAENPPENNWSDVYTVKGSDAKTYYVWCKVDGGDENHTYNGPWCIAVTIAQADPIVTVPAVNKDLTYKGGAQQLLTAGTAKTGCTISYAVKTDGSAPGEKDWQTGPVTAADPGTYYVWYKVDSSTENYKTVEATRLGSVTIHDAEAKIGGTYYRTLKEAIEKAGEGAEITVRMDVAPDEAITITKAVTLVSETDKGVDVTGAITVTSGSLTVNSAVTVYGVRTGDDMKVPMDMYGGVKVSPAAAGAKVEFLTDTGNGLRVGDTAVGGEKNDTVTVGNDGGVTVPLDAKAPNNVLNIDGKKYTNSSGGPASVTIYQDGSFKADPAGSVDSKVAPEEDGHVEGLRLAPGESAVLERVTVTGMKPSGGTVEVDKDGNVAVTKGYVTVKGDVEVKAAAGTRFTQVGDVTVHVVYDYEGGTPVEGAAVRIEGLTGMTDENGSAVVENVPYGTRAVTVTKASGGKVITNSGTATVDKAADTADGDIILPTVTVGSKVDSDLAEQPVVEGLDSVVTAADMDAAAREGKDAVITVSLSANTVTDEVYERIADSVRRAVKSLGVEDPDAVTDYVDVTVTMTVAVGGKNTTETVSATAGLLTLKFPISEKLSKALEQKKATAENIFVLRQHGDYTNVEPMRKVSPDYGKDAWIECYYVEDGTIVIRANQFSVYAFGVAAAAVEEDTPSSNPSFGGGSSTPSPSPTPTPTPTTTPTPGGDEPGGDIPAPPKSGTGWSYDYDTGEWYFYKNNKLVANYWVGKIDGASQWDNNWYYVGADGKMLTGMQYLDDLHGGYGWYFLQPSDDRGEIGKMLTGFQWVGGDYGECWFSKASGSSGKCTWSEKWGEYNAAAGLWADGLEHKG